MVARMLYRHRKTSGLWLIGLLLLPATADVHAQGWRWPDKSENLQVLHEDTSGDQLSDIMRGFTAALGVRCEHCHDDSNGSRLDQMDFAADTKETKEITRLMLQMVQRINGEELTEIERADVAADAEKVRVTCVTCHRGVALPRMLGDVLAEVVTHEGTDAGIARYRELREQYYGGFSYDFSERVLLSFSESLAEQGHTDAAFAFLALNLEMYPESWQTHASYAGLYMQQGDKDKAIEHLEKALAMSPDNRFLQRQLDQVKSQ